MINDNEFKIVYNSDLIIRSKEEVATLCVFYDKVVLPYTNPSGLPHSADGRIIRDWDIEHGTLFDEGVLNRLGPAQVSSRTDTLTKAYNTERNTYYQPRHLLWGRPSVKNDSNVSEVYLVNDSMILLPTDKDFIAETDRRLDPPVVDLRIVSIEEVWSRYALVRNSMVLDWASSDRQQRNPKWSPWGGLDWNPCLVKKIVTEKTVGIEYRVSPFLHSLLSLPVRRQVESGDQANVSDDLAAHFLRTDIDVPQIFTTLKGRPGRDVLVALEAKATFGYIVPKLNLYHPIQILDLREKVADTREGFTMHLWKLSRGLEQGAKEDVSIDEIAGFARSLIETELIPDYLEFRRQLKSIEAGRVNKVMEAISKVAEIDATPWTPKFYWLLMKGLGITAATSMEEQTGRMSNRYQAFKFMSDLQSGAEKYAV